MEYTTLKEHIKELQSWRNNRVRRNYDVGVLDRSLQVARAYEYLMAERTVHEKYAAMKKEEARKANLATGVMTLLFVAVLAFALGRK